MGRVTLCFRRAFVPYTSTRQRLNVYRCCSKCCPSVWMQNLRNRIDNSDALYLTPQIGVGRCEFWSSRRPHNGSVSSCLSIQAMWVQKLLFVACGTVRTSVMHKQHFHLVANGISSNYRDNSSVKACKMGQLGSVGASTWGQEVANYSRTQIPIVNCKACLLSVQCCHILRRYRLRRHVCRKFVAWVQE
jgi:hypothetical protein